MRILSTIMVLAVSGCLADPLTLVDGTSTSVDFNHGPEPADMKEFTEASRGLPRETTVFGGGQEGSDFTPITLTDSATGAEFQFNTMSLVSRPADRVDGENAFANGAAPLPTELSATINTGEHGELGLTLDNNSPVVPDVRMSRDKKIEKQGGPGTQVFHISNILVRVGGEYFDGKFGHDNNGLWGEFEEGPMPTPAPTRGIAVPPKGACELRDGSFIKHKETTCIRGYIFVCKKGKLKMTRKRCDIDDATSIIKGRGLRSGETEEEGEEAADSDGADPSFTSTTVPGALDLIVAFTPHAKDVHTMEDNMEHIHGDAPPPGEDAGADQLRDFARDAPEDEAPVGFRVIGAKLRVMPTSMQREAGAEEMKFAFDKESRGHGAVARTRLMGPDEAADLLALHEGQCDPLVESASSAADDDCTTTSAKAARARLALFALGAHEPRRLMGGEAGLTPNPVDPGLVEPHIPTPGEEVTRGPPAWPPREPIVPQAELVKVIDAQRLEHLRLTIITIKKWWWWWRFFTLRRTKKIDICPVRVAQRRCSVSWLPYWGCPWFWRYTSSVSGAGLAFGKPNADRFWDQAGVDFVWKPWTTVTDTSGVYKEVTTSEMSGLRATVNRSNCVEVFFVEKFSPSSTYGGGACWGGGTAGTKIVTSDEQVPCGVDKTHLAHELGHAIGIHHPGAAPTSTMTAGTAGTLMCGSGWQRDNPRRQSRENASNVQSPLFYSSWFPWRFHRNPVCRGGVFGDCGTCDEHIPSDSC